MVRWLKLRRISVHYNDEKQVHGNRCDPAEDSDLRELEQEALEETLSYSSSEYVGHNQDMVSKAIVLAVNTLPVHPKHKLERYMNIVSTH